jgi:uncharacterized protein (DUF427 family)
MRPEPDAPQTGQESVWAFPRPAVAEATAAHLLIRHRGLVVADTRRAVRTLETSHPPTYYIPPVDIAPDCLRPAGGGSFCEWKGDALYWDVAIGDAVLPHAGWSYPKPAAGFALLRDHVAFYAAPFDLCAVDGETVRPQAGGFYGGWITSRLAGPFKGGPGTQGW